MAWKMATGFCAASCVIRPRVLLVVCCRVGQPPMPAELIAELERTFDMNGEMPAMKVS
jgi:hypothetical protein